MRKNNIFKSKYLFNNCDIQIDLSKEKRTAIFMKMLNLNKMKKYGGFGFTGA